jgi:hypothetical protein
LGSKKYKNKPCVYCRKQPSEDGDHVVCREFFPLNRRANLPKVPACKGCNNDKSLLEHYLTAVLPFGARHQDAHAVIEMTPARLARNRALHERLALGLRHILRATNGGPWEMGLTVPLDSQAVEKLFEFVVKGLAWHHWRLELDDSHFVRASFLTAAGGQRTVASQRSAPQICVTEPSTASLCQRSQPVLSPVSLNLMSLTDTMTTCRPHTMRQSQSSLPFLPLGLG